MTWTPKNHRVALVVVPALLVVAFALGTVRGKPAHASFQVTPYAQSSYVPFVPGSFFTVSIQNALYDMNSQIQYAQAFSPTNQFLGIWRSIIRLSAR